MLQTLDLAERELQDLTWLSQKYFPGKISNRFGLAVPRWENSRLRRRGEEGQTSSPAASMDSTSA